jgi:hypothetical protein
MSTLDDRLVAFAQACKTKFDALNLLIAGFTGATVITPQQEGAKADGTTDDSAAFSTFQNDRLASKVAGFGYSTGGIPRGFVPNAIYYQGSTLDLYGAGILEGESGWLGSGSELKFAPDITGLRLQFAHTSGESTYSTAVTSPSTEGAFVRNLTLKGQKTGASDHPGIRIKSPVAIDGVFIDGFAGDGIRANAQLSSPGADPNTSSIYGNASSTQIYRTWVQNNGGDGFHIQGADASICTVLGCSAVSNGGYGFNDNSFFGNLWIGCHAAGNSLGAYHSDPSEASAHPTFLHCYEEGSQPQSTFSSNTLIIGGSWALPPNGGGYIYASGNAINVNALVVQGNTIGFGTQTSFGPQSGSAADNSFYLDNTNNSSSLFFRRWASGSPTTDGTVKSVSSGSLQIIGRVFFELTANGTRVCYSDGTGLIFDATKFVDAASLKIGGTTVIDSSRNSTPASVAIGGGTALTKAVVYAPSITPASVAAATVAEQTFTVTGLTTADKVIVNPPAIGNATGIAGARVSAADTLAIRFVNPTAGALTPTSGVYTVLAFRS